MCSCNKATMKLNGNVAPLDFPHGNRVRPEAILQPGRPSSCLLHFHNDPTLRWPLKPHLLLKKKKAWEGVFDVEKAKYWVIEDQNTIF